MKEHPIIFSTEMVKAILDNRKTQTRRIVKNLYSEGNGYEYCFHPTTDGRWELGLVNKSTGDGQTLRYIKCPYGVPGDHLWVKETWNEGWTYSAGHPCVFYRADMKGIIGSKSYPVRDVIAGKFGPNAGIEAGVPKLIRWRPSIYMPRWASRLTLEIINVRVEQVQDISEEDAIAEGVPHDDDFPLDNPAWCPTCKGQGLVGAVGYNLGYIEVDCEDCNTHIKRFRNYWNSINGKRGYYWSDEELPDNMKTGQGRVLEGNPWVWVIEFQKVSP